MTKHRSSDYDRNSSPAAPTSEGSTVFSLNALKAKAEAAARTHKSHEKDENSGLIDLKAMMAQAEQEKATEAASAFNVAPHLDLYPFGSPESAKSAVVQDEGPRAHRRPKRGRSASIGIAAALIGVAAIAAAAVSVGLSATQAPRPTLATPFPTDFQWAALPTASPQAAEKVDVASAQPAPGENDSDPTLATPRPPKEIPHIAKAPVLNRTAQAPAPKAPPAAPPPPAGDPCKGDLMCAMQRAVKK